jgi:hypothetical protein
MIKKAADGDSHRPTYHWSFCQSPVASMVPGFVLMPLVTLPPPRRRRSRLGDYRFRTTWAAARGDFKSR